MIEPRIILTGTLSLLMMIELFLAPAARAACANSVAPSCEVYSTCFAELCNCNASPYEYFKSYGEKYCKVFLDIPGLSEDGRTWRNNTLRCLQEDIVPMLPADGRSNTCDCKSLQVKVFDSHVKCYTQPKASICDLGVADWRKIVGAIDPIASLMDQKSRKQMKEVALICVTKTTGELRDVINEALKKL